MDDNILLIKGNKNCIGTYAKLYNSSKMEAFVFMFEGKTSKWLDKTCKQYAKDFKQLEWTWIHPEDSKESTQIPCLIMQGK